MWVNKSQTSASEHRRYNARYSCLPTYLFTCCSTNADVLSTTEALNSSCFVAVLFPWILEPSCCWYLNLQHHQRKKESRQEGNQLNWKFRLKAKLQKDELSSRNKLWLTIEAAPWLKITENEALLLLLLRWTETKIAMQHFRDWTGYIVQAELLSSLSK